MLSVPIRYVLANVKTVTQLWNRVLAILRFKRMARFAPHHGQCHRFDPWNPQTLPNATDRPVLETSVAGAICRRLTVTPRSVSLNGCRYGAAVDEPAVRNGTSLGGGGEIDRRCETARTISVRIRCFDGAKSSQSGTCADPAVQKPNLNVLRHRLRLSKKGTSFCPSGRKPAHCVPPPSLGDSVRTSRLPCIET